MNKEELEKLIALGYTQHRIATYLHKSQTNVRYWFNIYGLHTLCSSKRINRVESHCLQCNSPLGFKRNNQKYCSVVCQQQYQKNIIQEQVRNNTYTATGRKMIYDTLCADFGNKCSLCGLDGNNWNGKPIRLWVDHIDGYANNNNYSNFRLVCPNCDSQLDTCRAKNKGKGRKSLGMKVY
jgi:predicted transcriptional regulator